jgi:hypothetical protein
MKQTIFTAILFIAFCFTAFAQTNENSCPTITISYSEIFTSDYQILIFSADFNTQVENSDIKYIWTINGGKILAGEETKTVAILRKYNYMGNAELEIKGLPENCNKSFSQKFPMVIIDPVYAMKFDEYEKVTQDEEKERIYAFFVGLLNDPNAEGIIKLQRNEKLKSRIKFFNNYITLKGLNNRISFMISEQQENLNEFWIVPSGADLPDCKDCITIKAEDFDKLEKIFQPKSKSKNRKK